MTLKKGDPRTQPLSRKDEEALWAEFYASGTTPQRQKQIRDRMISSVLGLAVAEARKIKKGNIDQDDLIQVAMEGACKAFDKFEPQRGLRFNTYALHWVRAGVWGMCRDERTMLTASGFRGKPSDEGKKVTIVYGDIDAAFEPRGPGAERFGNAESMLTPSLKDEATLNDRLVIHATAEDQVIDAEERRILKEAVERAKLTDQEKKVLAMRIFNDKTTTLAAAGKTLGMTRERARQIEANGLRKIRRVIAKLNLDEYEDPEDLYVASRKL